ncbi:MAG: hypothetical protein FJ249_07685 [Nitrospira sp.]|nr:hypothetical protein [Nitrospira sp.]
MLNACDSSVQDVRLAAQDFRFDPPEVRLHAARPIRLLVVNEGREPHEFTSPLLTDHQVRLLAVEPADVRGQGTIKIAPGRSITLTLLAPAGVYLYRCKMRGHAGMTGTMIVDSQADVANR